jgi:hypothetical protein
VILTNGCTEVIIGWIAQAHSEVARNRNFRWASQRDSIRKGKSHRIVAPIACLHLGCFSQANHALAAKLKESQKRIKELEMKKDP